MSAQLIFDLTAPPALGRSDFFVSDSNRLAVAALARPQDWPLGKMLLTGPAGAGKTHLARIWAGDNDAATVDVLTHQGGLPPAPALLAEDVHRAAGRAEAEAALFHIHNMAAAAGTLLLMTAAAPPRDWRPGLADLASRMEATAAAVLSPPDDALLAAVLVKLFADRQLAVAPALIAWMAARMERSLAAAHGLVAALDERALAAGCPVSRALAAEVLDSMQCGQP